MAILDLAAWVMLGAGVLLLVPTLVVLAETLAVSLLNAPKRVTAGFRTNAAVLVPAHDEAVLIAETIRGIAAQLAPGDRLVVVADNCSDATADNARSAGAEVVERTDPGRRGKGYALGYGVRHIAKAPPSVLIVVDADCKLDHGSLDAIVRRTHATGRPVQAAYDMVFPAGAASTGLRLGEFAFQVKNRVRPLGLARLGLPCQLMGTGMGFPWPALDKVKLDSGELTEDLVLGLDLARAGYPPLFCSDARVTSPYPMSEEGRTSQRARWEAGHLQTIWQRVPGLVIEALRTRNGALLVLALDAAVPPLALHSFLLIVFLIIAAGLAILTGAISSLITGLINLACLAVAIILAWRYSGKDNFTLRELLGVPAYILSKVSLYANIFKGKPVSWIRTKRD